MAKTKEDYFNDGVMYASVHKFPSMPEFGEGNSWQSKAFKSGWDSIKGESTRNKKSKVVLIPEYTTLSNKFLGFSIYNQNGERVYSNYVKRKTHARNLAVRMGYEVLK